eukprot:756500-Hanusia_phi.AAC.2
MLSWHAHKHFAVWDSEAVALRNPASYQQLFERLLVGRFQRRHQVTFAGDFDPKPRGTAHETPGAQNIILNQNRSRVRARRSSLLKPSERRKRVPWPRRIYDDLSIFLINVQAVQTLSNVSQKEANRLRNNEHATILQADHVLAGTVKLLPLVLQGEQVVFASDFSLFQWIRVCICLCGAILADFKPSLRRFNKLYLLQLWTRLAAKPFLKIQKAHLQIAHRM